MAGRNFGTWMTPGDLSKFLTEAPEDGNQYTRKDAEWTQLDIGGEFVEKDEYDSDQVIVNERIDDNEADILANADDISERVSYSGADSDIDLNNKEINNIKYVGNHNIPDKYISDIIFISNPSSGSNVFINNNGKTLQLKVYAYKDVDGTRQYSYSGDAAEITISNDNEFYIVAGFHSSITDADGYYMSFGYPDLNCLDGNGDPAILSANSFEQGIDIEGSVFEFFHPDDLLTGGRLEDNPTFTPYNGWYTQYPYMDFENDTLKVSKLSLTDDGFIKTTNSDGTLDIDTNTYLESELTTDVKTLSALNSVNPGTDVISGQPHGICNKGDILYVSTITADPQRIYRFNDINNDLSDYDSNDIGGSGGIPEILYDSINDCIWGISYSALIKIDPVTLASTNVYSLPSSGQNGCICQDDDYIYIGLYTDTTKIRIKKSDYSVTTLSTTNLSHTCQSAAFNKLVFIGQTDYVVIDMDTFTVLQTTNQTRGTVTDDSTYIANEDGLYYMFGCESSESFVKIKIGDYDSETDSFIERTDFPVSYDSDSNYSWGIFGGGYAANDYPYDIFDGVKVSNPIYNLKSDRIVVMTYTPDGTNRIQYTIPTILEDHTYHGLGANEFFISSTGQKFYTVYNTAPATNQGFALVEIEFDEWLLETTQEVNDPVLFNKHLYGYYPSVEVDSILDERIITDHSELDNLPWLSSGHSGSVDTLAGFDENGLVYEYDESDYILADGTRPFTGVVDGVTPTADDNLATKGYVDSVFETQTETLTAGENVVAGEICYLKSDGKYWRAKADAEATTKGRIVMANATITADNTGTFITKGNYTDSGLTVGGTYFLSISIAGVKTTTTPTSGNFVRVLGWATSATNFYFKPSDDYGEVS